MILKCPECAGTLNVPEQRLGRPGRCPKCQKVIVLNAPEVTQEAVPPRVGPPPFPPKRPPVRQSSTNGAVSPVEGRQIMDRHRGKIRATWIMEEIPAKDLAKARAGYAKQMTEGETPLVLGKTYKVLVTDRYLYGDGIMQPIPLRKIITATHSRYDLLNLVFNKKGTQTQSYINGRPVMSTSTGTIPFAFVEPVLEELGEAARRQAPVQADEFTADELTRIAAAAVCVGRPMNATTQRLASIGQSQAEATKMFSGMAELFNTPNRVPGIVMIVGGLIAFGICFAIAVWLKKEGSWVRRSLYSVGVAGVFALLAGIYHILSGKSGLDEDSLVAAWKKRNPATKNRWK